MLKHSESRATQNWTYLDTSEGYDVPGGSFKLILKNTREFTSRNQELRTLNRERAVPKHRERNLNTQDKERSFGELLKLNSSA